MSFYLIPLTNEPYQTLECTIPINGLNKTLKFKFYYNDIGAYWLMDVFDGITGVQYLASVPILTSDYPAADILEQYGYLQIGSAILVKTADVESDQPDDTQLGTEFALCWGDNL